MSIKPLILSTLALIGSAHLMGSDNDRWQELNFDRRIPLSPELFKELAQEDRQARRFVLVPLLISCDPEKIVYVPREISEIVEIVTDYQGATTDEAFQRLCERLRPYFENQLKQAMNLPFCEDDRSFIQEIIQRVIEYRKKERAARIAIKNEVMKQEMILGAAVVAAA